VIAAADVRALAEEHLRPRAAEIDARGEFPTDVLALFRAHGVFAAVTGDLSALTRICEEIARVCANSGMLLGNQYLGAGPVLLFGSEAQREEYLPRFASGEWLCSFALTEPEAGSDARALRTRALRHGEGWTLSGRKCFITQANVADVLTVFARAEEGITAFLVTREDPGWEVDKVERKLGLRGSPTCSVALDAVVVGPDALVGRPGDGLKIALTALNKGRIMTASLALGIAQGALEAALAHARPRPAVRAMLADMETDVQAARALVRHAAERYDAGDAGIVRLSASTKLFATDMVNRVTAAAVDVVGLADSPAERMLRDARIFSIFEGTNQIQRLVIARELVGR
jgi:alkylation response protein AidB-like acyl-CoA dehydrogenase